MGVALGAVVTSNAEPISGFTGTAPITIISNGAYSVGCTQNFTNQSGTVVSGQTVCLQQTAAQQLNTTTTSTIVIGGVSAQFAVTTINTTPAAFSFTAQTGVAIGGTVRSNTDTITGLTGAASVTVQNGSYSIGCTQTFTSQPGTITNGQTICVQQTASSQASTDTITTLTIGGVSAQFKSTTAAGGSGGNSVGGGGGGGGMDSLTLAALLSALAMALRPHRREGPHTSNFSTRGTGVS
jgi:hypothetical protein